MLVRYLDKSEYEMWNRFVDESPEGSIYGKTWYLDALSASYKILVVINDKEIFAGIALAKNEIHTFSNPLLCKYLGIYFKKLDGNESRQISKKIELSNMLIFEIKKVKTFDYTFHPNYNNWLPFYWAGYKQTTKYSYLLEIENKSKEDIFQCFSRELKNRINKFSNVAYTIDFCNHFELVYSIIKNTYLRKGVIIPFQKKKLEGFINKMQDNNSIKFVNVFYNDIIIAFTISIHDKNAAYLILHGVDNTRKIPGNHEFAIFNTILQYNQTHKIFDFEGSMIKKIEFFYRKFGGTLIPYSKIYKRSFINILKEILISKLKVNDIETK